MGKRESKLKEYLFKNYGSGNLEKPKLEIFQNSIYNTEIKTIYRKLEGQLSQYPVNYHGFDIICNDFVIELDEERHFNRYRLITLNSHFYKTNNYFDTQQFGR